MNVSDLAICLIHFLRACSMPEKTSYVKTGSYEISINKL